MIYFDNASIEKTTSETIDFAKSKLEEFFGNSSEIHTAGQNSKAEIEHCRSELAGIVNTTTDKVFFTTGRAEANNIVINSIKKLNPNTIITSVFEHNSILKIIKKISSDSKIPIIFLKTYEDSGINLENFKNIVQQNPNSFISLSHVNNYTGRLLPIKRISKHAHKNNCIFHSDISQSIGKFDVNLQNIDTDIITAGSEQISGIIGAGFIASKNKFEFSPAILGDNKEYGISQQNENILAISTMLFSLKNKLEKRTYNFEQVSKLKSELKKKLDENNISYNSNSFSKEHFSPYTVNIKFSDINNFQSFLIKLDLNNICVSDLSKTQPNPLNNQIQISFSTENTINEIGSFIDILKFICK